MVTADLGLLDPDMLDALAVAARAHEFAMAIGEAGKFDQMAILEDVEVPGWDCLGGIFQPFLFFTEREIGGILKITARLLPAETGRKRWFRH